MNSYVKVFHHTPDGLSVNLFDVYTPDAAPEDLVEAVTLRVRNGCLEAVDMLGKVTVLDSLEDAERVVVGTRVIWPKSAVKYAG